MSKNGQKTCTWPPDMAKLDARVSRRSRDFANSYIPLALSLSDNCVCSITSAALPIKDIFVVNIRNSLQQDIKRTYFASKNFYSSLLNLSYHPIYLLQPCVFTRHIYKIINYSYLHEKKYNNSFHEKNDKNKVEKETRHRIEIKLILKVS